MKEDTIEWANPADELPGEVVQKLNEEESKTFVEALLRPALPPSAAALEAVVDYRARVKER